MKILYYIHFLSVGGAEKIAVDYLINLKKKNVDVVLVVLRRCQSFLENQIIDAGIKMYALNESCGIRKLNGVIIRINRLIGYEGKWKKILAQERPDIIHAHTFIDTLKNVNFPSNRIVFTFHAQVERSLALSSDLNKNMLKTFAENGMTFFSLTEQACRDIVERYPNSRVVKMPNAIDINKIKENTVDRDSLFRNYDIPKDAFILGHVGRFHPVKNHEKIISVFEEVRKLNEKTYLLLIGGDNGNRINLIKNIARERGLLPYIKFLGVREDATAIMSLFDVFILPSFSESFSLATVEAQVFGKRCVVSDNVPEEVCCNDNCFRLGLDKSDKEWAELILSESIKCRHKNIQQYDIEIVINHMIEAYSKICEE